MKTIIIKQTDLEAMDSLEAVKNQKMVILSTTGAASIDTFNALGRAGILSEFVRVQEPAIPYIMGYYAGTMDDAILYDGSGSISDEMFDGKIKVMGSLEKKIDETTEVTVEKKTRGRKAKKEAVPEVIEPMKEGAMPEPEEASLPIKEEVVSEPVKETTPEEPASAEEPVFMETPVTTEEPVKEAEAVPAEPVKEVDADTLLAFAEELSSDPKPEEVTVEFTEKTEPSPIPADPDPFILQNEVVVEPENDFENVPFKEPEMNTNIVDAAINNEVPFAEETPAADYEGLIQVPGIKHEFMKLLEDAGVHDLILDDEAYGQLAEKIHEAMIASSAPFGLRVQLSVKLMNQALTEKTYAAIVPIFAELKKFV